MRTLRLCLAGTVSLALLGGLGMAVVAQDEEELGSEDPRPVSGTMVAGPVYQSPIVSQGEDREVRRGGGYADTVEMDDARLSGTMWNVINRDVIGGTVRQGLGALITGTVELVNDDGSWVGAYRGYTRMGPRKHHWQVELTGTGAYSGLSALLQITGAGRFDVEGFIFPGVLPEYPDPVEVPAD